MNFSVPQDIYVHICGTDLIRDRDGNYLVLEDNLRCPSGVSYMIENRAAMRRAFPNLFQSYGVRPVEGYPKTLLKSLRAHRPAARRQAQRRPADARGLQQRLFRAHLPRPPDGHTHRGGPRPGRPRTRVCYMRTTAGLVPVDVIYRRIDDDFLDPSVFRPDSMLGVPGLVGAYRAGKRGARELDRHRAWRTTR